MKTILYNPIFINPQAYYVFPRLTRYLQPDNESTSEPANYIGTIEVKVIAYGDTALKRTYTNTDSIDLSEFKNTWIRISLFTKVGSCVLGEWKIGNVESDLPYIDPEVLASLKAVVIVGNKTNNDSDRAIVKNLVDPDNPFVISNAAYEGMSGYNGYPVVFGSNKTWETLSSVYSYTSDVTSTTIHITRVKNAGTGLLFSYVKKDGALTNIREIPAFRVTVKGLEGNSKFGYRYLATEDATGETLVYLGNGTHELSKSFTPTEALLDLTRNAWVGIFITPMVEGEVVFDCDITMEILPEYEGAFVTDGIDDLITSTKTVQEMLGGSNEITVVSMIHQIGFISSRNYARNNYFIQGNDFLTNTISAIGKIGIYGYKGNLSNIAIVNDILGDKKDYSVDKANSANIDSVFSVNGTHSSAQLSSVAWFWTIIANKVLTTDQINQVIAYFNLDRTLKPDILCNTIKQGITNENHAEFGDKLIDFSGNGRDIQLNNLAWKGGSGIAAKQYETFKDWTNTSYQTSTVTEIDEFTRVVDSTSNAYWVSMINRTSDFDKVHDSINIVLYQDDMLLVHECKYKIDENVTTKALYETLKSGVNTITLATIDKFTDIPEDAEIMSLGEWVNPKSNKGSVKITLLPSYKGGLLLDGVNDFGKVTGMPVYKDYTVVTDREIFANIGAISSKNNPGAFVETAGNSVYSFGQATSGLNFISTRSISYLSKYSYCGQSITAGAAEDGTDMWLGTIRDNDTRFFNGAIYSLMSFPYSMSEFLIERQLKKHKLGTLYPDMVEFRPIVTYDKDLISKLKYFYIHKYANWVSISPGDYLPNNAEISFTVDLRYPVDEVSSNLVFSNLENVRVVKSSGSGNSFDIRAYVTNKSPQKINITIDEYIRYEDIVQPYPVLLRFKDENGNEVSWGGKFKVGSNITRIGSIADPESNLLNGLYSISGLSLNGKAVTSSTSIVEKQMVFRTTATWLLDNNEPKCILSPRLLRIPNSSYKILGHIPDISGHGNHGKINNSAYASMSGANGYLLDFKTFTTENSSLVNIKDDSRIEVININKEKSTTFVNLNKSTSISLSSWKIKVTGMKSGDTLGYYYSESTDATLRSKFDIKSDGIYSLPSSIANSNNIGGIAFDVVAGADSAYRIEQIGEYESAYCLDGVDDFVTIPTLSSGGKQVLMKVNWDKTIADAILYDQRGYPNEFAIYNADVDNNNNPVFAYQARNNGQTYIDGILNKNIKASELRAITHNITITNELSTGTNTSSPVIGSNRVHDAYFTNMALYDFMLFDNISTDDKILELNEYVGIEGNTEWRKTE